MLKRRNPLDDELPPGVYTAVVTYSCTLQVNKEIWIWIRIVVVFPCRPNYNHGKGHNIKICNAFKFSQDDSDKSKQHRIILFFASPKKIQLIQKPPREKENDITQRSLDLCRFILWQQKNLSNIFLIFYFLACYDFLYFFLFGGGGGRNDHNKKTAVTQREASVTFFKCRNKVTL